MDLLSLLLSTRLKEKMEGSKNFFNFRYVAWARVSGPSSDCGSSGQAQVTTEDQIQFYFKSSKKSNNGTDVNAGQLPQLLYKLVNIFSNFHKKLNSSKNL